jgi:hypothetical protein
MSNNMDNIFQHQDSKGQEMQSGERLRQSLIISRKAAKPCRPPETTLNHPAARQQHKTFLASGILTTSNSMPFALASVSAFARVAHINKGQLDRLTRCLLHLFRQFANKCAVAN